MAFGGFSRSFSRLGSGVFAEGKTTVIKSPLGIFDDASAVLNPDKPKDAQKTTDPPTIADPAVEAERQAELLRIRRRRGLGSTILTSPLGDTSDPTIRKKVLLGA